MGWLADSAARRSRPDAMWPDAITAIVLTMNYVPTTIHRIISASMTKATYGMQGRDYHDVIKGTKATCQPACRPSKANVKVFVDTAPLMEKPLWHKPGQAGRKNIPTLYHETPDLVVSWQFILTDADLV